MIVIGVDTHKGSHALSAVDDGTGRVRGSREIKADDAGHLAAVRWARGLDEERVWAVEDCRHVSRRFEQALLAAGERVIRVPPKMMGASRRAERERGKSDEIDAQAVARAVVKDGVDRFPTAYLDERAMQIRLLSDHREDLVGERTRVQNRLRWHLLELCPELEAKLKRGSLSDLRQLERLDRRLRRIAPGARLRVAREELAHIRALTRQAEQLERELLGLIRRLRPRLLQQQGCGTLTAALLIGRTAGAERFRSDACSAATRAPPRFPALPGANPAPARPRRRPPAQPGATHDRNHTRPPRPRHQELPRTQRSRRQNPQGRAAPPQALSRAPLRPPAHRAAAAGSAERRGRAYPRADRPGSPRPGRPSRSPPPNGEPNTLSRATVPPSRRDRDYRTPSQREIQPITAAPNPMICVGYAHRARPRPRPASRPRGPLVDRPRTTINPPRHVARPVADGSPAAAQPAIPQTGSGRSRDADGSRARDEITRRHVARQLTTAGARTTTVAGRAPAQATGGSPRADEIKEAAGKPAPHIHERARSHISADRHPTSHQPPACPATSDR